MEVILVMTEFMKPSVLWARLAASVHEVSAARMWANGSFTPGSCGGAGAVDVGDRLGSAPFESVALQPSN